MRPHKAAPGETHEDAASCTLSRAKYTARHARDSDCVLCDAEPSVGSEPERPSNLEIGLTPKARFPFPFPNRSDPEGPTRMPRWWLSPLARFWAQFRGVPFSFPWVSCKPRR